MKKTILFVTALCLSGINVSAGINADGLSRTTWAEKLKDGPIRVVCIAPYAALQDSYELSRRFDMDVTAVGACDQWTFRRNVFGIHSFYWPDLEKTEKRVFDDIRSALESDWEVVSMSDFPTWDSYPKDIRDTIIESVQKGRVLMLPFAKSFMKDLKSAGIKLEESDIGQGHFTYKNPKDRTGKVYHCGKGYIVNYAVGGDRRVGYLMRESSLQSDYEFDSGWAGWLMCKTAMSDSSEFAISAVYEKNNIEIKIGTKTNSSNVKLNVVVRNRDDYKEVFRHALNATPGSKVFVKLPYLASGDYQAEIRAIDDQGFTLDWDALMFEKKGPINISTVIAENKIVSPGDKVKCSMDVTGDVEGLRIMFKWFDNWGRLLLDEKPKPFSKEFVVRVPDDSMSVINYLEISLISTSGEEARAKTEILMPANVRTNDGFSILYWDAGSSGAWRKRLSLDVLRREGGADGLSNCPVGRSTAQNAAAVHLRTVPYTTSFHNITLADQLLNENWLSDTENSAREAVKNHSPYNPIAYTLGDEIYVSAFKTEGRFSNTPKTWELFQTYLRKKYPDLESLNKQWNTSYTDWAEIKFESEKELLKDFNNPSAWVDYRMFINNKFADGLQRMRLAIQEESPGAWVGWDGTEQYSSYDGYDWWQVTRNMDLIQLYAVNIAPSVYPNKMFNGEAVSSFRPEAKLRGAWLNSVDRYQGGDYTTWYLFLNGWNSIWWWHATFLHPADGALTWDLQLSPVAKTAVAAAKEIKEGPGALLAHAKKIVDPIAIHYSENNWHASTVESGIGNHVDNLASFWTIPDLAGRVGIKYAADDEFKKMWSGIKPTGHYAVASKNFYLLLHDLGFQPRTIARQEIEDDTIKKEKIKVIFLPFVVSLTDKEIDKIKEFVKSGGLLIADYRCGLRDGHGRIRKFFPLDEVFGIKRDNVQVVRKQQKVALDHRNYVKAELATTFRDSIVVDSARVCGYHEDGSPAFLLNKYFKGNAIYLNFDLYSYSKQRKKGFERDVRESFRSILMKLTSIETPQPVARSKSGSFLGATECVRWVDGQTTYVGLIPDYRVFDQRSESMTVQFPEKTHVYDIRKKRYLGNNRVISDSLEPGMAKFYAALPYKVSSLSLAGPEKVALGQRVRIKINVKGTSEKVGPHSVRIKVVFSPDGTKPEYLAKTIYLPNGIGEYSFVPALNTPAGTWKIYAVECFSGKKAEIDIKVK